MSDLTPLQCIAYTALGSFIGCSIGWSLFPNEQQFERSYLEAGSESEEEPQIEESRDNRDDRKFDPRRKGGKFRGNNNNNNRRRDNNNNNKKRYNNNYRDNRGSEGGFMKSIFKIFKSNDNN
jgi:hypothetical protein